MNNDYSISKRVDDIMKSSGFDLSFRTGGGLSSYINMNDHINVTVDPQNNSFELFYAVDRTVFKLSSGNLSPFMKFNSLSDHFSKMYNKFLEVVIRLRSGNY